MTRFLVFARIFAFFGITAVLIPAAYGAQTVRWTGFDDQNASLEHVITVINQKTGLTLTTADFRSGEQRPLAFNNYQRFDQVFEDAPIRSMSIRLWTRQDNGALIQLDAQVEDVQELATTVAHKRATRGASLTGPFVLTREKTWAIVKKAISSSENGKTDLNLQPMTTEDAWQGGRLVRFVEVKARRGKHTVQIDVDSGRVISTQYKGFPRVDPLNEDQSDEFSVPARIYPFYEEEKEGELLPRETARLKYIKRTRLEPSSDVYSPLRDRHYFWSKQDPIKGETEQGRAQGFWSIQWILNEASRLSADIPVSPNDYADGVLLQGRYATINIHPNAFEKFAGIEIEKKYSPEIMFDWLFDPAADDYEIVPVSAFLGKPLFGDQDALTRPASRPPVHNPALYINEGFDELQVYYAINQLFDALRPFGFTDPDLAERPFHAYLFNPDIEYVDNAYYTDDTINFTTYSPHEVNMARDNLTIWHELGHGVMDRLMGTRLDLADTGGLSEGMADFVADMVLQASAFQQDFPGRSKQRINNQTGFFLTNEVHDDGEAYGGTMKALLDAAIARDGYRGLSKVVDLVLEAMRLSRDHPSLTADLWFERVYFADQLGRPNVRGAGEMRDLIDGALNSRNFASPEERAQFSLVYGDKEITGTEPGTRDHEINVTLAADSTASYDLTVKIADGVHYHFDYPVTVKVFFESGALQGAIDWIGEENEPMMFSVAASGETVKIPLQVRGTCDAINRTDGTCSDYAYVQVWNAEGTKPVAKKRFYLKLKTADAAAH